jgi:membrane-associated phospholipid phosphatase
MSDSNFWRQSSSLLEFLKKLLSVHWRSLLLLLVGVFLPLLVFEQLAIVIWENQGGFPWDNVLLLAIHTTAQPHLDQLAEALTDFGTYLGVFPASITIALVLLSSRQWRSLIYFLTAQLGSSLISMTAKILLHRIRPGLWESAYPLPSDFAFPSGHAMSSMTLIVALIVLTWGSRWCWLVSGLGGLFVITIAWTRLYLGVHFPSDILAGWMVSIAWAIGTSLVIRPGLAKQKTLTMTESLSE